jgi:hypothetical protein
MPPVPPDTNATPVRCEKSDVFVIDITVPVVRRW